MFNSKNFSIMQKPYQAVVVEGKWESLEEYLDDDEGFSNIEYPMMTVAKDTVFHIAVHSKSEQPLKQLLERVANYEHIRDNVLHTTNAYENTVLHEAAINHNIAAVKLLVGGGYVTPQHLQERNKSGQTPLFKAAAFGSTKVVKYLATRPNQTIASAGYKILKDAHRINNDGFSILHAAVRGEHFGTALELLKMDKGLAELKTKNGITSLHLLTNLESAFSNKFRNSLWHRLVNFCIPTGNDNYDDADNIDEDEVVQDEYDDEVVDNLSVNAKPQLTIFKVLETINKKIWKYLIGGKRGWPALMKLWKEKRRRKFAFQLARILIKNDDSWQRSFTEDRITYFRSSITEDYLITHPGSSIIEVDHNLDRPEVLVETPLLAATRTGMIEIVRVILNEHPQAVEHVSYRNQNILHVAAGYRQREVFELVKKMQIPTSRLIMGIDKDGYTVLHHVADIRDYHGGTRPGLAYQLQEELEWFQIVEEIMPSFLTKHRNKDDLTAKELFKEKHRDQLKAAQAWIKETSQSCTAVAVLIVAIVFTAAFTDLGGIDYERPIINDLGGMLVCFTISDVISLSCSLTAVVMFLSILISSYDFEDFHFSLPRRLTFGFALLFMSVATTMLAFASTFFISINSEKNNALTISVIGCAAIFPVSVFALTHFPLFVSFVDTWKNLFTAVWESPPSSLVVGSLASVWNILCFLIPKKKSY